MYEADEKIILGKNYFFRFLSIFVEFVVVSTFYGRHEWDGPPWHAARQLPALCLKNEAAAWHAAGTLPAQCLLGGGFGCVV